MLDQQVVAVRPVHKETLEVTAAVRKEMSQVRPVCSVQFNPLADLIVGGSCGDDSAEIPFQSLPQEALVGNSGCGRDVHSLMLSIRDFLCRPRRRPPSRVP